MSISPRPDDYLSAEQRAKIARMKLVVMAGCYYHETGTKVWILAEHGYEGRVRNCGDLYQTLAKWAIAGRPDDAPNPCLVPLDPPWDGPHVFARITIGGNANARV